MNDTTRRPFTVYKTPPISCLQMLPSMVSSKRIAKSHKTPLNLLLRSFTDDQRQFHSEFNRL